MEQKYRSDEQQTTISGLICANIGFMCEGLILK
jgi:hypothetical protein